LERGSAKATRYGRPHTASNPSTTGDPTSCRSAPPTRSTASSGATLFGGPAAISIHKFADGIDAEKIKQCWQDWLNAVFA
jgi:hypothetical protein